MESPELLFKSTRAVKINPKRPFELKFWLSSEQDPVKIRLEMIAHCEPISESAISDKSARIVARLPRPRPAALDPLQFFTVTIVPVFEQIVCHESQCGELRRTVKESIIVHHW
jgi:hypothetical protein